MITESEYKEAVAQQNQAESVINTYHKQRASVFEDRWKRHQKGEEFFSDEELTYASTSRCHCGAGLAYPKNCGGFHQWSCSDCLTGRTRTGQHDAYPFAFYEIKSEIQPSANGYTTRPK